MALSTVDDIYKRVTRLFGDEAGIQLTEEDILNWINDGMEEIHNKVPSLPAQSSYLADLPSADAQGYKLPVDGSGSQIWLNIQEVAVKRNVGDASYYPVRYITRQEMAEYAPGWDGDDYSAGIPVYYVLSDDRDYLRLFPESDVTISDGLRILYTPTSPSVSALADTLPIHSRFRQAVMDFVMFRAYEQDEDWAASDRKLQSFNMAVSAHFDKAGWADESTYPSIRATAEDYYD